MKKNFVVLTIVLLIATMCLLSGCNRDADLYEIGLQVTTAMDEIVKSDYYFQLLGYGEENVPSREGFIANDYDSPERVYIITIPDTESMLKKLGGIDDENYNQQSDTIKKQIIDYHSFITIVPNIINGNNGNEAVVISQSCRVKLSFGKCKLKSEVAYLYVFETGTPILVLFTPDHNSVTAQGVFLDSNKLNSLSEVRELFETFGCTVNNLER